MIFKRGDRVRCTRDVDSIYETAGLYGTVLHGQTLTLDTIAVRFDVDVGGHSCEGLGPFGMCLFCLESEIVKVSSEIKSKHGLSQFLEKHS